MAFRVDLEVFEGSSSNGFETVGDEDDDAAALRSDLLQQFVGGFGE